MARVDALPDSWFQRPYRSREDAFTALFGDEWSITDARVDVGFSIPAVLLTHTGSQARVCAAVFGDRWYPPANEPSLLAASASRPQRRPRTRDLRAGLRDTVRMAVGAPTMTGLLRKFDSRAESGNPHAAAHTMPMFTAWMKWAEIEAEQAHYLRVLVALGGWEAVVRDPSLGFV